MSNPYESKKLLSEYLLFHFGNQEEILPWSFGPHNSLNFPVRTVAHFSNINSNNNVHRSLDLGCAVGRSTFELSKTSEEVLGIDYSQSFIDAAKRLANGESLEYEIQDEGNFTKKLVTHTIDKGNGQINFEQGDATDLRFDIGQFDRVHAANLVCRVPNPNLLLQRLPDLVKTGGELVLATPCTWLEEYTKPEYFPNSSTLEWLQAALQSNFELVKQADEPFLIREHSRKYQWTVSMVTVWRRK